MAPTKSLSTAQAALQLTRNDVSWAPTLETKTTVTYGYRASITPGYDGEQAEIDGFMRFTQKQIAVTDLIFDLVEEVCGVVLKRVNPTGFTNNASILLSNYVSETDGNFGYAYQPIEENRTPDSSEGDFWYNLVNDADPGQDPDIVVGSNDYNTVIHELGHALGLEHPSDYPDDFEYDRDASYREDSLQYSVMSYFEAANTGAVHKGEFLKTLGLHDIAALQRLYGVNTATRTGNDIYGFGGKSVYGLASASDKSVISIWDAGGTDTLNFSKYANAQVIDLNAEKFSSVGGLKYNVSIAKGVVIENAVGGSGKDTIIGNKAANTITGGAGFDTMDGGDGGDTLNLADAKEGVSVQLAGSKWVDVESVGSGKALDKVRNFENVTGGKGDDYLGGDAYANKLSGGAGADVIGGGRGTDTLSGGSGADYFQFGGGALAKLGLDVVTDFARGDRILLTTDTFAVWEAQDEPAAIDAGDFSSGTSLKQMAKGDVLFYDKDDGLLFYDADGAGTGGGAVKFAELANHFALGAGDIFVL